MKKVNILEITNTLGIGGTEKTMQIFCKYLNKNKLNVFACGFYELGKRFNIINKYSIKTFSPDGDFNKLIKFIKQKNISIVHWHSIPNNSDIIKFLQYCKEKNIKIIETSPFSLFKNNIEDYIDLKLFVSKTSLLKFLYKYSKKINNQKKYNYLYNPIDTKELLLLKTKILNSNQNNRQKLGIKEKEFIIGKIGRANLWKWDDSIINIVKLIKNDIPNFRIIIRSVPEIKINKIKKMGLEKYFIFLPESIIEKEIVETYLSMDIMLHTCRIGESFGMTLAEGMFFGLPIITTYTNFLNKTIFERDSSQSEIVINNENGYTCSSLKEIKEKIILLYNNKSLINSFKNRNKKRVINYFEAKKITKKLEEIILENKIDFFDYKKELEFFKKNNKKNTIYEIIKINIIAIYDKFINKA